jgi:hypothetical protein
MKKILIGVLIALVSTGGFANSLDERSEKQAAQIIFHDADVKSYICIENANCNFDDFFTKLSITEVNLGLSKKPVVNGILIEPLNRGLQYFSAVFLFEQSGYRLVFAPDVTLSGIKFLNAGASGMRRIRATERLSNDRWNESDYSYNVKSKEYAETRTICYGSTDSKTAPVARVKCE